MNEEHRNKIKEGLRKALTGEKSPPTEAVRLKSLKADLKKRYGLSLDDYVTMLKTQDNKCAICYKEETAISRFGTPKRMAVDHCHTENKVRGLLCEKCNRGLGYFCDNSEYLLRAAEYLKSFI